MDPLFLTQRNKPHLQKSAQTRRQVLDESERSPGNRECEPETSHRRFSRIALRLEELGFSLHFSLATQVKRGTATSAICAALISTLSASISFQNGGEQTQHNNALPRLCIPQTVTCYAVSSQVSSGMLSGRS